MHTAPRSCIIRSFPSLLYHTTSHFPITKMPPSRGDTCGTFTTDSQATSGNNVRRGQAGYRGGRSPSVRGGRAPAPTRGDKPSGLVAPLIYSSGKPARVDSRIEAAEELVTRLRGSDHGPGRPVRPGWGTQGREIAVRTNFFPVELTKDILYEYTVKISPEPRSLKPHVKRRVLELFEKSAAIQPYADKIAHDGANRLIAAQRLPRPLRDKVVYFEDGDDGPPPNPDIYTVEVTFSRELHTEPLKRCARYISYRISLLLIVVSSLLGSKRATWLT